MTESEYRELRYLRSKANERRGFYLGREGTTFYLSDRPISEASMNPIVFSARDEHEAISKAKSLLPIEVPEGFE